MLWEECKVDRNESQSEMNFSKVLIKRKTSKCRESIEKPTKDGEYNTHSKNIMEMSNNIVSVVKNNINSRV
jgi:hypothetical protein